MDRDIVQKRTHRIIALALRIGLALSSVLAALAIALGRSDLPQGATPSLHLEGRLPVAIASATVSLVVLAATPALRVVLLGALWARQRDWRFVLVAVAIAGVLATCVLLGRAG